MASGAQTLLQLVTRFSNRTGLPAPSNIIGNQDSSIVQLQNLLEEECVDLAARFAWEGLVNEAQWPALGTEDQGTINSLAPNGFNYIIKDTFWDRTQRLPIIGPLSSSDWQAIKAIIVTGPRYQWRFRGLHMLINPAPVVGHDMRFEYVTRNWCNVHGASALFQNSFGNDDDLVQLPDDLVLLGLRWRYKKEKRLAYGEDFETYEKQVADAMTRDKGARVLHMDDLSGSLVPGVWVPPGSWPLS